MNITTSLRNDQQQDYKRFQVHVDAGKLKLRLSSVLVVTMPEYHPPPTTPINENSYSSGELSSYSWKIRALFTLTLVIAALVSGTVTFSTLRADEKRLFELQYRSIASAAVETAVDLSHRTKLLTKSAATLYKYAFPDADQWPNVAYKGFYEFSDLLAEISSLDGQKVAFFPIVEPHQGEEFEKFAADWLDADPSVPEQAGIHSFGRGIYAVNESLNSTDNRYHDVTAETTFDSRYKIMTPLFQTQSVRELYKGLLFNAHSHPARGTKMDDILDCVKVENARLEQRKKKRKDGGMDENFGSSVESYAEVAHKGYAENSDMLCDIGSQLPLQCATDIAANTGNTDNTGVAYGRDFVDEEQYSRLTACSKATGIVDLQHLSTSSSASASSKTSAAPAVHPPRPATNTHQSGARSDRNPQKQRHTQKPTQEEPYRHFSNAQSGMYYPIIPANNPGKVVGFTAIVFPWTTLLNKLTLEYVSGLDVVIETSTVSLWYKIRNGLAYFDHYEAGLGDLLHTDFTHADAHQSQHPDTPTSVPPFPSSQARTPLSSHPYAEHRHRGRLFSVKHDAELQDSDYYISIYPNEELLRQYYTHAPARSSVGALLIVLSLSVLFFVYDWAMKREVSARQLVLDTKRRFVRFISHEVRTPLNTGTGH